MPEIIGPDGTKYYTKDHFDKKSNEKSGKDNLFNLSGILQYAYLIGGIIALIIGIVLLADVALGVLLLVVGRSSLNYYWARKK